MLIFYSIYHGGKCPADEAAPVVSHEVELVLAEARHQLPEVLHQGEEKVAVDTGWLLRVAVATHVQGHHVVILSNDTTLN